MGNAAAAPAGDHLRDYGPARAARAGADPPVLQDLSGTTVTARDRPGAADADADSADAEVPSTASEGLRAGRSRERTKPEYTEARGRLNHATFRERADKSVHISLSESSSTCPCPTRPGPGTCCF